MFFKMLDVRWIGKNEGNKKCFLKCLKMQKYKL